MKLDDFTDSAERPIQTGANMHSHDRTMLAGLGFADPDKKNPQHDLACLYLSQRETCAVVLNWLLKTYRPVGADADLPSFEITKKRGRGDSEYHLMKGEGQYATTVGFIDVLFQFGVDGRYLKNTEYNSQTRKDEPCDPRWVEQADRYRWTVFAEVKIARVGIGDILRQLNLYSSYFRFGDRPKWCPYAILVAPWDLSVPEAVALKESGFGFLKLGKPFQDWQVSITAAKSSVEL